MKACRRRVRKDVSSRSPSAKPLRCVPETVDSGTSSDRLFPYVKLRVISVRLPPGVRQTVKR